MVGHVDGRVDGHVTLKIGDFGMSKYVDNIFNESTTLFRLKHDIHIF